MWLPIDQLLNVPETHQDHPHLLRVEATRSNRGYSYLSWQVTHPPTPVVWTGQEWYEIRHSSTTGRPYREGTPLDIYPTPRYEGDTPTEGTGHETDDSTNLQIRHTPVVIEPNTPGSPHRTRSIESGTPSGSIRISIPRSSNLMATQTMASTTETISHTRTAKQGEQSEQHTQHTTTTHQNPYNIRDTFDIALGRAPRGPGGPGGPPGSGGPGGPGDPNGPGSHPIPPALLVPIHPGGDLKPAGVPPLVFNGDRTRADAFLRELRIYILANQGVPGFESPI